MSLLDRMNLGARAVVVNQCSGDGVQQLEHKGYGIHWINSSGRGLSRSRNMALSHAAEAVCLLGDDDLEYRDGCEEIILEQFKRYPEADVITFQVEGIERPFKTYHPEPRRLNFLTSMKVSSVEIAFRRERLEQSGIRFKEQFGAGAVYRMGEENIFLAECLRKGLKIQYVPVKIADLHIGDSSWFKGYDRDYFISRGAAFTAMSRLHSLALIVQFAARKHGLFKEEMSRREAVRWMLEGRRRYLRGG
ncbi:glycosyltransferase family 2 protein [Paenibacillus pinistramenti]|uniref:glycosyltransferase family 2 protein n=1 Tax=Paenibacillus pinistramenti TaxID=1768003 RepID=UPI001396C084|nr:glycosyltransferase [Paenibacillus pinistramenti]